MEGKLVTRVAGSPSLVVDPAYDYPDYHSTSTRAPREPLVLLAPGSIDKDGPVFSDSRVQPGDADLTRQHHGEPLGQRINVSGRLVDSDGRPIAGQLVEVWQCNAAGRYRHPVDQHPAPLDPNFTGAGRCITGADGGYRFVTIKPGAYPWRNHPNAWRPSHIHFSAFGRSFTERLVTQMYFPGDPLLDFDPIYKSVRDRKARLRMVSVFDWATTEEEVALGYRFDIVVGGHLATPPDVET
jgi:protocatechuate 3,4-dioxygenase beta subunit